MWGWIAGAIGLAAIGGVLLLPLTLRARLTLRNNHLTARITFARLVTVKLIVRVSLSPLALTVTNGRGRRLVHKTLAGAPSPLAPRAQPSGERAGFLARLAAALKRELLQGSWEGRVQLGLEDAARTALTVGALDAAAAAISRGGVRVQPVYDRLEILAQLTGIWRIRLGHLILSGLNEQAKRSKRR
ncbi:MAG: hypothetical protein ACOYJA_11525 [Christensenellales bacterium]|jgi:ABC-type amino acid transport substrate-binding protein